MLNKSDKTFREVENKSHEVFLKTIKHFIIMYKNVRSSQLCCIVLYI